MNQIYEIIKEKYYSFFLNNNLLYMFSLLILDCFIKNVDNITLVLQNVSILSNQTSS